MFIRMMRCALVIVAFILVLKDLTILALSWVFPQKLAGYIPLGYKSRWEEAFEHIEWLDEFLERQDFLED